MHFRVCFAIILLLSARNYSLLLADFLKKKKSASQWSKSGITQPHSVRSLNSSDIPNVSCVFNRKTTTQRSHTCNIQMWKFLYLHVKKVKKKKNEKKKSRFLCKHQPTREFTPPWKHKETTHGPNTTRCTLCADGTVKQRGEKCKNAGQSSAFTERSGACRWNRAAAKCWHRKAETM